MNGQKIPGIIYGFSTRAFGDMNDEKNKKNFLHALKVQNTDIVSMNQVHRNRVVWVDRYRKSSVIENADGLLTSDKNVFLSAKTADCLPILFYDSKKEYIGIAHAGWRGLVNGIIPILVQDMVEKGTNSSDLWVGIGPSIRSCCYRIDKKRQAVFSKAFPAWVEDVFTKRNKQIFLDMQEIAKRQLISLGVAKQRIEESLICTQDSNKFFSFRRGDGEKRCIGIIGRI